MSPTLRMLTDESERYYCIYYSSIRNLNQLGISGKLYCISLVFFKICLYLRCLIKVPPLQMPTLRGKSFITVDVINNQIRITNSGNNQMLINLEHWNRVIERMNIPDINARGMTSRYARGNREYNWYDSPDMTFSPNVPAVMEYIHLLTPK